MILTEDEYRKKWCPEVRVPWFDGPHEPSPRYIVMSSVNRTPQGIGDPHTPLGRCIASDCAMWRWARKGLIFSDRYNEEGEMESDIQENDPSSDGIPRGYCGKAGKP